VTKGEGADPGSYGHGELRKLLFSGTGACERVHSFEQYPVPFFGESQTVISVIQSAFFVILGHARNLAALQAQKVMKIMKITLFPEHPEVRNP